MKNGLGGASKSKLAPEVSVTPMSFVENIKDGPVPAWADGMGFNPVTKSVIPIARPMKEDPLKNYEYKPKNTEYVSFEEERSGKGLGVRKPRSVIHPDESFVRKLGKHNFNYKEDSKLKNAILNRMVYLEKISTKAYKEPPGEDGEPRGYTVGIGDNDPSYNKDTKTTVKAAIKKFRDVSYDEKLATARDLFSNFDDMPENLQVELFQGVYRGDFVKSDYSVALINAGRYREAAKEFLNNKNYIRASRMKNKDVMGGIKTRMEDVRDALLEQAG